MSRRALAAAVCERMRREGITQRELGARVGASQGHLSRVLRGKFKRRSRVVRLLEAFATGQDAFVAQARRAGVTASELRVLRAVREVARGDEAKLVLISEVVSLLARLQQRT